MSTDNRQIRFTPLVLDGSGTPAVAYGNYLIEPTSAYDEGTGRVEVLAYQISITGSSVTKDLPVTATGRALKVVGTFYDPNGSRSVTEYVTVPAGTYGTVLDFEDLTRVDPTTLEPLTTTTAWTANLTALVVQDGGSYPAPLPTGFASIEFRGSVDPATQFTLTGNYLYKWVETP